MRERGKLRRLTEKAYAVARSVAPRLSAAGKRGPKKRNIIS